MRPLDAAAVAELDRAFAADPAAARVRYSGVRFRFPFAPQAFLTDLSASDGAGTTLRMRDETEADKLADRRQGTVEGTLAGYDWAGATGRAFTDVTLVSD